MNKITSEIIKALKNRLPGRNAQLKMAPMNRARINLDDIEIQTYRKSAVMILFCEDENQNIFIPLIERMSYDGVHSGQISFPGGKFDIDDVDLKNTALRECLEEIGIIDADIIGELSDLPIPVSKFLVKPFLGISSQVNPKFNINKREVNAVIILDLKNFLENDLVREGEVEIGGGVNITVPYFEVQNKKFTKCSGDRDLETVIKINKTWLKSKIGSNRQP